MLDRPTTSASQAWQPTRVQVSNVRFHRQDPRGCRIGGQSSGRRSRKGTQKSLFLWQSTLLEICMRLFLQNMASVSLLLSHLEALGLLCPKLTCERTWPGIFAVSEERWSPCQLKLVWRPWMVSKAQPDPATRCCHRCPWPCSPSAWLWVCERRRGDLELILIWTLGRRMRGSRGRRGQPLPWGWKTARQIRLPSLLLHQSVSECKWKIRLETVLHWWVCYDISKINSQKGNSELPT